MKANESGYVDDTEIMLVLRAIFKALNDRHNPDCYEDINEIIALKFSSAMQVVNQLIMQDCSWSRPSSC